MSEQLINEIEWQLESKVIKQRCDENPYGDWERIGNHVREEFAKWLVEKFVEETYSE